MRPSPLEERVVDGLLCFGAVLLSAALLSCGLQEPLPSFQMYTPSEASTGRLRISVVPAEFYVERSWDVTGPVPVLVVKAATQSHPGRALVQVRRRSVNSLGGSDDELQDFAIWFSPPGRPATFSGRFSGQRGTLSAQDQVVIVVEALSFPEGVDP